MSCITIHLYREDFHRMAVIFSNELSETLRVCWLPSNKHVYNVDDTFGPNYVSIESRYSLSLCFDIRSKESYEMTVNANDRWLVSSSLSQRQRIFQTTARFTYVLDENFFFTSSIEHVRNLYEQNLVVHVKTPEDCRYDNTGKLLICL